LKQRMSWLTLAVVCVLVLWWVKPLRDVLVQRTNRTVKVLLVVFPLLFLGRAGYLIYTGEQGEWLAALLTVAVLLVLWVALMWLGNTLERRRPTQVRPPDLAALSKLPGMPRIPAGVQQAASSPDVQRAAQVAAEAAARVDWSDVAGSVGRTSGRWAARLRKSMADSGGANQPGR
jgi:hypothetical protein